MKKTWMALLLTTLTVCPVRGSQTASAAVLDSLFACPPDEAKPLMIWQWMDGVVSREGITADLEAYRAAGLGGVQQFQIGGPLQGTIRDTTNAIGTENWQQLMRHAIRECERLGLSFGTHNCPGWSSSAYPTVLPQDAMQELVWTIRPLPVSQGRGKTVVSLPERPKVDERWDYYEDIAVLLVPDDSTVRLADIRVFRADQFPLAMEGARGRLLRFGHTTNGKTNAAQAPYGGVGLECDKMSREAVRKYWDGYPSMLLRLAGEAAGKTFQRIEIDSYEAGGQGWTKRMAEEFEQRRGYPMLPWLAVLAGITVESPERSAQFRRDYAETGTDLFAENYYGYMAQLAHQSGLRLLYQPYGTSASKPFNPINTEKIARKLPDDLFCTEFWTHPDTWGWPGVPRHMKTAHQLGLRTIYAEGFTCWPLSAWKDDPQSLKPIADRAFAMGVNRLMLHAGAQNPWPGATPGMTFGKWGTQWTPGQTWWQSGGARQLFAYFSRCQALLQQGDYIDDYKAGGTSLTTDFEALQWIHRRAGEADIYFIANPADSAFSVTLQLDGTGRLPELWHPDTGTKEDIGDWRQEDGKTRVSLQLEPYESAFIVLRHEGAPDAVEGRTASRAAERTARPVQRLSLSSHWTVTFPEGWGAPDAIHLDSLTSWTSHADKGVKYFSGTARYTKSIRLKRLDKSAHYVLDLGEVKNLARVVVNGQEVAHLWKKPFRCDITAALRRGENVIEIDVTNLWVNRMIGDEQEPDDVEWCEPLRYDYAPGKPLVGQFMKTVPDWLRDGKPRPSTGRHCVVSFKFFTKDSPLLPSGLLGPVHIVY